MHERKQFRHCTNDGFMTKADIAFEAYYSCSVA